MGAQEILKFAAAFWKEAINFSALTRRVKYPIISSSVEDDEQLTALQMNDKGSFNLMGGVTIGPVEVPLGPGAEGRNWMRLHTLWSSNERAGIYLLGAALAKYGALVPDTAVSPAAQLVLKSYWNKYKDNPNRVVPEVLAPNRVNQNAPWLRAGYVGDEIGDAYGEAFAAGQDLVDRGLDVSLVSETERNLFKDYHSTEKSGINDPRALRETRWLQQQGYSDENAEKIIWYLENNQQVPDELIDSYEQDTEQNKSQGIKQQLINLFGKK